MKKKLLIFVDLDGVLADFEQNRFRILQERGQPGVPPEMVTDFYGTGAYTQHHGRAAARLAREVTREPGFFLSMLPVPHALDGMRTLIARGHDVRICSKPLLENPACTEEKREWIRQHLGRNLEETALIVKKKSEYKADFLIDDRPNLLAYTRDRGELEPVWKHILFRQPWNADSADHYRVMTDWQDWAWLDEAEDG